MTFCATQNSMLILMHASVPIGRQSRHGDVVIAGRGHGPAPSARHPTNYVAITKLVFKAWPLSDRAAEADSVDGSASLDEADGIGGSDRVGASDRVDEANGADGPSSGMWRL